MEVSILQGTYADGIGNARVSMPINMWPVLGDNGLSDGFLRTAPGITTITNGPGADRGAIVWGLAHYRVMGSKLVQVSTLGVVTTLGDVGTNNLPVSLDYGTDRVAIASNGHLFYWNGTTLNQVTDPNLGTVIDMCYIDGYYMTTDGTYLVVTELNDPMTVNPLKYGSSEADPDPIQAVKRVRDEIYAVNLNTIENFQNVGGSGFPFQRNPGGMIQKGACNTHAVCYFKDTLAFVGCGRGERLSVYLAGYGTTTNISTPDVDRELAALTLTQISAVEVESVTDGVEQRLYVHLPTKTLVYHDHISQAAGKPIWTQLVGGGAGLNQPYPGRHFVHDLNQQWNCGSAGGLIGYLDETVETQFGASTTCRFDTKFLYNNGKGAILKSAELIGSPGLVPSGPAPLAYLSWTRDGVTWSQELSISLGVHGDTWRRMQWRPKTRMRTYLGLRFRLPAAALASFMKLEVEAEPLNV